MEPYLVWMILGFTLVIVELVSGTFYLLMLGIAALGAAAAAYLGQEFPVQAIVAAVVAAAGCYAVHVYRAKNDAGQMASIDQGQPASFESWIDRPARLARVRYRGAQWEARLEGRGDDDAALESGALLYVVNADGNTLKVAKSRPA